MDSGRGARSEAHRQSLLLAVGRGRSTRLGSCLTLDSLTVAFLIRPNYRAKFGGDVLQMQAYAAALTDRGHRVEIVPIARQLPTRQWDIAHIFNVDRPLEFIHAFDYAYSSATRTVVSTIHHPIPWVEEYEQRARTGAMRLLSRALPSYGPREYFKHILRDHRPPWGVGPNEILDQVGVRLERAHRVLVLSRAEQTALCSDFSCTVDSNVTCLPNGIHLSPTGEGHRRPSPHPKVLVAGRIESRKNSLALAEALSRESVAVTFAGGASRAEPDYVRAFRRLASCSSNIEYLGQVSPDSMPDLYGATDIVLSASHFEVFPLVELEAAGYGCRMIGTTRSLSVEYSLADERIEPTFTSDAIHTVLHKVGAEGPPPASRANMVRDEFSWSRIGDSINAIYQELGAGR